MEEEKGSRRGHCGSHPSSPARKVGEHKLYGNQAGQDKGRRVPQGSARQVRRRHVARDAHRGGDGKATSQVERLLEVDLIAHDRLGAFLEGAV